jgi:hypothetical protein
MTKIIYTMLCIAVTATIHAQNVGIGEVAPGSKLSVNGSLSVGSSYSTIAATTDGAIILGNVGIGTPTPATALHVSLPGATAVSAGIVQLLQPGLTAATLAKVYLKLGVALTSNNEADIYFNYIGIGSASNSLNIGFYGSSPVATFKADYTVTIPGLAGTGYRPVIADPSGTLNTLTGSGSNRVAFAYSSSGNQSWTVPTGVSLIYVKLWGAGGGSAYSTGDGPGGGGGFVSGFMNVTPGASLTIIVGRGGIGGTNSSAYSGTPTTSPIVVYGGGGVSGEGYSGTGGGRSAIQITSGTDAVTAGAGGGGGKNHPYFSGGGGGGLIGGPASQGLGVNAGGGGTQVGGGVEIVAGTPSALTTGGLYQGGKGYPTGSNGSPGGGGGYYGGAGGGISGADGGAGGGSSYISGLIPYLPIRNEQGLTCPNYESGYVSNENIIFPGGTDGPDYVTGVGMGAPTVTSGTTGNNGGNGYVVIYW